MLKAPGFPFEKAATPLAGNSVHSELLYRSNLVGIFNIQSGEGIMDLWKDHHVMKKHFLLFCLALLVGLPCLSGTALPSITYDLAGDWNPPANPNGTWAYWANGSPMSYTNYNVFDLFPQYGDEGGSVYSAAGTWEGSVWLNTNNPGTVSAYPADGGGTPVSITWTAPTSGTAEISGFIYYNQPLNENRIQIFSLGLSNGNTLVAPTEISGTQYYDAAHPLTFDFTGLTITAGEILTLNLMASPGQDGSSNIMDLTILLTPNNVSAAPVPALSTGVFCLLAFGLAGLFGLKRKYLG
jgi:hypothetical protein